MRGSRPFGGGGRRGSWKSIRARASPLQSPLLLPRQGLHFLPQAIALGSALFLCVSHPTCSATAHQGRAFLLPAVSTTNPQALLCFKDFMATLDRERSWWDGGEMVTRIITVGKTQRVKRVEFQLPLVFTEMENGNRAGTAILRGLSQTLFLPWTHGHCT